MIAIIGLAFKFPGNAIRQQDFWNILENGKDCVSKTSEHRPHLINLSKLKYPEWGGYIHDYDKFDASFFNTSPREAELMDPQQRLFLEVAWETIEDGGYKASSLSGSKIGVFAGAHCQDYFELSSKLNFDADAYGHLGLNNC